MLICRNVSSLVFRWDWRDPFLLDFVVVRVAKRDGELEILAVEVYLVIIIENYFSKVFYMYTEKNY